MKSKALFFLILSLLLCPLANGNETEPAKDQTMLQTEPACVNHPSLTVLSFLVGRWEGTVGATTIEEVWTPMSSGSMIGLRKRTKDGRIETQVTVMEEGKFGAFGKSQSFDCYFMNKETADHPRSVILDEYSAESAKLQFVDKDQDKEMYTYKLVDKNMLSVSMSSGESVKLTRASN